MKKIYLLNIFILTTFFGFAQPAYKVAYGQLKEYEGLYEYFNKGTIKIAVSPRDTIVYAIINESKYKLSPVGKDLFMDMTKTRFKQAT